MLYKYSNYSRRKALEYPQPADSLGNFQYRITAILVKMSQLLASIFGLHWHFSDKSTAGQRQRRPESKLAVQPMTLHFRLKESLFECHLLRNQIYDTIYNKLSCFVQSGRGRWVFGCPGESPAAIKALTSVGKLPHQRKGPVVKKSPWRTSSNAMSGTGLPFPDLTVICADSTVAFFLFVQISDLKMQNKKTQDYQMNHCG